MPSTISAYSADLTMVNKFLCSNKNVTSAEVFKGKKYQTRIVSTANKSDLEFIG